MADEAHDAEVQQEATKNVPKQASSDSSAAAVTAEDVSRLKEKLVVNGDSGNGNAMTTNENSMDSNVSNNGHDGDTTSNGCSVSGPSSPKNNKPQVVSLDDDDLENPDDEEEEEEDIMDEEDGSNDEEESQDDEDIQEVKDDESSDSDVMEVDAEDPLSATSPVLSKTSSSLTSTEVRKPQVVTIDDPKALQALASSARSKVQADKDKVTLIDTSAILAGRATSGVTITPARPKSSVSPSLPSSLTSSLASSGVTISSKNTPVSSFVYDSKGQLQDPNLTDDTIVIEAPSFIVPYVYEKPPMEKFEAFKAEIKKLMAELKAKAEEEAKDAGTEEEEDEKKKKKKKKRRKQKEKSKKNDDEEDNGDLEDDDDYEEDDEDDSDDDSDIVELAKRASSPDLPPVKKPNDNYFESSLGKFVSDLGMNMVQEAVQQDLLRQQQRKAKKDKSAAVMHAIISLKKNIEQSKENNAVFHSELKKCKLCSFRTESQLVMDQHLETPHMRHGLYRCNHCHYETKHAQEVLGHMLSFHNVRAKLERAPALHQCPQCPFEDMMKGKLTRHKVGCDKRFRPERNQEPAHDWEPPAKIAKPPTAQVRPGVSVLNAQGRPIGQNFAGVRGALQQFNQQPGRANPYSNMPSLQFGPAGRVRPNFSKPFVPFNQRQQQGLSAYAQAGRLAGNPSVTIQSISKTSSLKSNNPSISITPVPGGRTSSSAAASVGGLKPGAPGGGKDNFIICEICDGYIRDLDQLRNHMQFVHKVKIHPKMIYNRPPLNCQKCQFRFFTDQGLERHLLGSHGLVTASMQDLANKGQDQGRCPVCGKMFHWKLLNHVAKDHMKVLKPAHLSYKCTVCTATFGQYKLFENHVYSAHSGGRKTGGPQNKPVSKTTPLAGRPFKMSDEITIIPQGRNTQMKAKSSPTISSASLTVTKKKVAVPASKAKPAPKAADDPDVIEIDDEEEEIDDVEEENEKKRNGTDHESRKRKASSDENHDDASKSAKTSVTSSAAEDSGEEGVEEIRDDEPEDDDD